MSDLKAQHPSYGENLPDWIAIRDAFKGERHVKGKGREYLPALVSHVLDGMKRETDPGLIAYESYKMRAQFPDYVQTGVETLVGILNAQPAVVKLPKKMEYLRQKASVKGETLNALIRRIHEQQFITGRCGLLGDLPANPDPVNPLPYLALYNAESILNWDDGGFQGIESTLNLVVLDETSNKRNLMDWTPTNKFRVLQLGIMAVNETKATYRFGVFEGPDAVYDESQMRQASLRGKPLNEIPFVFINSKDTLAEPDIPPLLGLSRLCYSIYRSEADYRHALYMQGQDTLVVVGGVLNSGDPTNPNAPIRIGAGSRIDTQVGGDAKFIGTESQGIPEMRTALENDRSSAAVRTGQLLAPGKMSMESGEALKTRVAAQTATLTSVALSCAGALERLLKMMAEWLGENPDEVGVVPNLDFTNVAIEGQDLVQLITAKNLGYPLSTATLHDIARAHGLTNRTLEEETEAAKKDEQVFDKRAKDMAVGLKGNNPLQAAGGPTTKPANNKSKKPSNKPA